MISWIQRTFQQHFRIIFGILLFITIISFVFIYNPASGIGRGERTVAARPFFGVNLSSDAETARLMNDAALSVQLHVGYMGLDNDQLQEYALQRKTATHLADEFHIPTPTQSDLASFLKALRVFAGADGTFDAKRYEAFRDSLKVSSSLSEGDVTRVIVDDWRLDRVQKYLGGPGYVQSGEITSTLLRSDSTWTINVVTADYTAYSPGTKPTESDLTKYFEDNVFRYEIPPQVRVTFVDFPAADYISKVMVTDDEAKAYYESNPARFPKPAAPAAPATPAVPVLSDAKDAKPDLAADFAAVKPSVIAAIKLERGQKLALKEAAGLSLALYEGKVSAIALPAFLASRKLATKPVAPFSQQSGSPEFAGSADITDEAFKLSAEHYHSDAVPSPTGAVVLFWQESLPPRKPLLTEVRDKVSADFIENDRRIKFVDLGKAVRTQIEARLKAGDTIEQATASAATASGLKLEAKSIPSFSLRQPPQDVDSSALGTLSRLDQGQVSDMVITKDKGFIVHAVAKKLPDLTEANPLYATTRDQLASAMAQVDADAYLRNLKEAELLKTAPASP